MNDESTGRVFARLNRMDDKLDRLLDHIGEFATSIGSLEALVTHIRSEMVAQSARIDRLDDQIEKVERRLELRHI